MKVYSAGIEVRGPSLQEVPSLERNIGPDHQASGFEPSNQAHGVFPSGAWPGSVAADVCLGFTAVSAPYPFHMPALRLGMPPDYNQGVAWRTVSSDSPMVAGDSVTVTPASDNASIFEAAVPSPPLIIAPAWRIVRKACFP